MQERATWSRVGNKLKAGKMRDDDRLRELAGCSVGAECGTGRKSLMRVIRISRHCNVWDVAMEAHEDQIIAG